MRVMRITLWMSPQSPLTTVTRDADTTDSLESVREKLIDANRGREMLQVFTIFELGEHDEADLDEASRHAMDLFEMGMEAEMNMAVLYFFACSKLPILNPGGTFVAPSPAPMTEEAIRDVFGQVMDHPSYRGQRLIATSEDGPEVSMRLPHA